MKKQKEVLLGKTLFRRLFFSYIIIIFLCVMVYSFMLLWETRESSMERLERASEVLTEEVDNLVKQQVLTAQNIVTELTYSTVLKKLYLSKVSGTEIDAASIIDIKEEILNAKVTNGLMVVGTWIFLSGDRRAFSNSGIANVGDVPFTMPDLELPYFGIGTMRDLLGFTDTKRYSFMKEYLFYMDYFTYQNGTNIGVIAVPFDLDALKKEVRKVLPTDDGIILELGGQELLRIGNLEGEEHTSPSRYLDDMTLTLYSNHSVLEAVPTIFYIILSVIWIVTLGFIFLAYRFSRKNYKVIGAIENLVDGTYETVQFPAVSADDEAGRIVGEIEKLIGEKKKVQDEMITIAPFAKAGMIHGVLTGNMDSSSVQVLRESSLLDLKKPYFTVSVVNLPLTGAEGEESRDLRTLFEQICRELSGEEIRAVFYITDPQNVFVIVNSDLDTIPDEFFYQIHRRLTEETEGLPITIGVDMVRDSLMDLSEACEGARKALDSMILGGRNTVYFREDQDGPDKAFDIPKNFSGRMEKAVSKGDKEEISSLLADLYNRNTGTNANISKAHALADDLYLMIARTLRQLNEQSKSILSIEKYTQLATLQEIFAYYEASLHSAAESCAREQEAEQKNKDIEKEFLQYIEDHYTDPDLSLQLLTEKFHITNRYVGIIFHKYHGTTYLAYIQNKRIQKAKELLETGEYSLAQVCELCGYTSQLTFRRNFKAVLGINPSELGKNSQ